MRLGSRSGGYILPPGAAFLEEMSRTDANALEQYYRDCFTQAYTSGAVITSSLVTHQPVTEEDLRGFDLVTMLRDPDERAVSHWLYTKGHGVPFWDYIRLNRTAIPKIAGVS